MSEKCEVGDLLVAQVDSIAEALDAASLADVDVIRVQGPPRSELRELAHSGFLVKPYEVNWITETSPTAHLPAPLARKIRQGIAGARRAVQRLGATSATEPLTAAILDEFLDLYGRGLERMRNPISVASRHRDRILDQLDEYVVVAVRRDTALVAALLCLVDESRSLLRLRFSAAESALRQAGASRVTIADAIAEASRRGLSLVSLGSDLNLYGHIVQPGLLGFKLGLGFHPRPDQEILGHGVDVAEKVLRLRHLTEPTFVLAYDEHDGAGPLRLHQFVSDDPARWVDTNTGGLHPITHQLPQ